MDVYCHPFTSGVQEIPIQEAKFTELITLVTNYSCGEEMCESEAGSLPLDWASYTEHGTEFIKASTSPKSIAKQIYKVYKMSNAEREALGKKARKWVVDNFSTESVCSLMEKEFELSGSHWSWGNRQNNNRNPFPQRLSNRITDEKTSRTMWDLSLKLIKRNL